jgi:hypothetical protein
MPIPIRPALRRYALGLAAVVAGAGLTSATGSMLPLAGGAALAVLTTATLVRDIRERAAARRRH